MKIRAPVGGAAAFVGSVRDWTSLHVLHRHGDRAPSYNVFRGTEREAAERELWAARAPPAQALAALAERFPVRSAHADTPHDQRAFPFGTLTALGLEQTRARGRALAAQLADQRALRLDARNVRVLSTNFVRTQTSAQGVLSGLLGEGSGGSGGTVDVAVLPREQEIVNGFERHREVWDICGQVQESAGFRAMEDAAADLRERFRRHLPSLRDGEFRWIMAVDHSLCRAAHGVPDEHALQALGPRCKEHLRRRFWTYFRQPGVLRLTAAPLLAHVLASARDAGSPRVRLYSGHDVTVLSVLAALGLPHAEWPEYASALEFAQVAPRGGAPRLLVLQDGRPVLPCGAVEVAELLDVVAELEEAPLEAVPDEGAFVAVDGAAVR